MAFVTRSLLILTALYGLVFVLGDVLLLHSQVSLFWGVGFAVALIGIQYAIAPWLIERVFTIWWDDPELPALPAAQREFVEDLCRERRLPPIRLGVIESGTPNAFAFGRVRPDARIVVTRGLLDMLTPEEANAVLAHEVGHVAHYDFAIMAAAALAPLLLYQIYVWTRNVKNLRALAFGAYLAYWAGQLLVLLLNRTREYHADHFSACVTRQPSQLSSALVKIAYGMVRCEGEYRQSQKSGIASEVKSGRRTWEMGKTVSLLGISAVNGQAAYALGMANPQQAAAVMRWDLINPWAGFYELNSTHPLTAKRVRELNRVAGEEHQVTPYPMPAGGHANYARFGVELFFWVLPLAALFGIVVLGYFRHEIAGLGWTLPSHLFAGLFLCLGLSWGARIFFRYQGTFKPEEVATLLEDMDVSQMRPRAVELRGEIVGNGLPGAFWSPDLVLRDQTGLMFVLYRSSVPLGRLFFGITDAWKFIGEEVVVQGWYRRGLRPYVELSSISAKVMKASASSGPVTLFGNRDSNEPVCYEQLTQRSWSRWIQLAAAAGVTAIAAVYLLA